MYVLDEFDEDTLRDRVKKLRDELGDAKLDVSTIDWVSLGKSLDSLANVPTALLSEEGGSAEPSSLVPVLYGGSLVLPGPYTTFESFEKEGAVRIRERGNAKLTEATERLLVLVRKEPKRKAAADYYARFLPPRSAVAAMDPGLLRRIILAVQEMLEKLAKSFAGNLSDVWRVLQDPDSYYLRLRGELAEWEDRRAPDAAWLKWVMLAPDLFRLYVRLLLDDRVSHDAKLKLLGALAYVVLPYDLVPEGLLGPAGFVDDVYVASALLAEMTRGHWVPRGLLEEHWGGPPETLDFVMRISEVVGVVGVPFLEQVWSWLAGQLRWAPSAASPR